MDFEMTKDISVKAKNWFKMHPDYAIDIIGMESMLRSNVIAIKRQYALQKDYTNAKTNYAKYRSAVLKHFRKKRYWSRKKAKRFHKMRVGGITTPISFC